MGFTWIGIGCCYKRQHVRNNMAHSLPFFIYGACEQLRGLLGRNGLLDAQIREHTYWGAHERGYALRTFSQPKCAHPYKHFREWVQLAPSRLSLGADGANKFEGCAGA